MLMLLPTVINCNVVDIFDSSKLQTSPIVNLDGVRYTISTSVADINPVICATASLLSPIIFSPNIADVSKFKPLGNVNLSSVGESESIDSKTPITFTTSGTFNDISLSSTLKP